MENDNMALTRQKITQQILKDGLMFMSGTKILFELDDQDSDRVNIINWADMSLDDKVEFQNWANENGFTPYDKSTTS